MIYVKIMVDEDLPANAYQVAPNIRVVSEEDIVSAILGEAKTVYCPDREAGHRLREIVETDPEMEELGRR